MYKITDISKTLNCKSTEFARPKTIIKHLLIDTRTGNVSEESLFFALKGEKSDGHVYLKPAYNLGVRNFVVSFIPQDFKFPNDCNVLVADNTLHALQKLAAYHRQSFSYPVIAITGSNGKTIVKELLAELLNKYFKIVKSPKSFNSQIGVPLSVWEMTKNFDLAIFEAGISLPGEMEKIEEIIQPTIGIFTNIGTAHEEGFESIEEKLKEKLRLFKGAELLIYSSDQPMVAQRIENELPKNRRFSWSCFSQKDPNVLFELINPKTSQWRASFGAESFEFENPFRDLASRENLFQCIATLLALKISPKDIIKSLTALKPIESRLEIKEGKYGSIIIDDTYNNDLAGLKVAIDYLISFGLRDKKIVILSAMAQLANPLETYSKIAQLLTQYQIDEIHLVGKETYQFKNVLPEKINFYESTESFLSKVKEKSFADSMILIKGGRVFSFEKIVHRLTNQIHSTRLEIDLEALVHNFNFYKSLLKPTTKIMVMVKASAYGSGAREVAKVMQHHNVDYLAVAYSSEGIALRQNGITKPIMVLNSLEENFEQLLQWNLEPEIYSISYLKTLLAFLLKNNAQLNAHLNLDTGMHRLGFMPEDHPELSQLLELQKQIKIKSIYTHLVASENPIFDEFSISQLSTFYNWAQKLSKNFAEKPLLHALNTSGISRFQQFQFDMVRLGIGLHGIANDEAIQHKLLPVASLKTQITQIKKVAKGNTIGYGRMGKVDEDKTIAIVSIGYADGYSRMFSNGVGGMMVGRQYAPTIGNVCMDMTMLDITHIEAQEGDQVEVFGKQQNLIDLAKNLNIIPYELLTNVNDRVKRTFFF